MYIFLDVDGVLNTQEDWSKKIYSINQGCVEVFAALLKEVDSPKVVLSSTWRCGIARDGSTAVHVQDLLTALSSAGITQMDRTAVAPDGVRSKEIDYYLRRHPEDTYLILDDDSTLFEMGAKTKGLYLTNPKTGLTLEDVKKLKRMLSKK